MCIMQAIYRKWASKAKFESKLPGDVNARKKQLEKDQRTLDASLVARKLERVVPYTHKLFRKVAVDWLVATDQVILYRILLRDVY
jgi:hypothetical protein